VIKSTDVPRNANVKRKLQKNSVPNMDIEKTAMDIDCWKFNPDVLDKKNNPTERERRRKSFLSNLSNLGLF
jgi:hypothetical protein